METPSTETMLPEHFNELTPQTGNVEISGQVLAVRQLKNRSFIDIGVPGVDSIQAVIDTTEGTANSIPSIGDVVAVAGKTGETQASIRRNLGVVSIFPDKDDDFVVLAKNKRPRWPGADERERQEAQADYTKMLLRRNRLHRSLRGFLEDREYVEIETSILQDQPSGAAARTFDTKANFDGSEKRLRIAPEIDLKVTMALSGLGRVYELARNFRNEGASPAHHPEFTSLEVYTAHMNKSEAIDFTSTLLGEVATAVQVENPFAQIIPTRQYGDLLEERLPGFSFDNIVCASPENQRELMQAYCHDNNLLHTELTGKGPVGVIDWLFKRGVRPHLQEPVIIMGYLQEQMPLAAPEKNDPCLADAFQIIYKGAEIVKAYCEETNDERLISKLSRQRDEAEDDAVQKDDRLIRACQMGLPPMYGVGVGMDRTHALLVDRPVSSVIPVPINNQKI
jgi:lysyl-tRNA synthetase class 2